MSDACELRLESDSVESLRGEFDEHLSRGGCFIAGDTTLSNTDPCVLVLMHPGGGIPLRLPAHAVWVSQTPPGVGVEIDDFCDEVRQRIATFVNRSARSKSIPAESLVHAKLRALSPTKQLKFARESGDSTARVILERIYGKHVWPALLANPRLTVPEVMRIARMGQLPIPLLEQIAQERSWIGNAQVRRILLANPRSTVVMVRKMLLAMPRAELRIACQHNGYPRKVREAARQLFGR